MQVVFPVFRLGSATRSEGKNEESFSRPSVRNIHVPSPCSAYFSPDASSPSAAKQDPVRGGALGAVPQPAQHPQQQWWSWAAGGSLLLVAGPASRVRNGRQTAHERLNGRARSLPMSFLLDDDAQDRALQHRPRAQQSA